MEPGGDARRIGSFPELLIVTGGMRDLTSQPAVPQFHRGRYQILSDTVAATATYPASARRQRSLTARHPGTFCSRETESGRKGGPPTMPTLPSAFWSTKAILTNTLPADVPFGRFPSGSSSIRQPDRE
jgi:hypothetical protein